MVPMAGLVLDLLHAHRVSLLSLTAQSAPSVRYPSLFHSVLPLSRLPREMLRIGVLHPLITNKKEPQWTLFYCRWRDLNPQGSLNTPLKRARIPIPPHRHK